MKIKNLVLQCILFLIKSVKFTDEPVNCLFFIHSGSKLLKNTHFKYLR